MSFLGMFLLDLRLGHYIDLFFLSRHYIDPFFSLYRPIRVTILENFGKTRRISLYFLYFPCHSHTDTTGIPLVFYLQRVSQMDRAEELGGEYRGGREWTNSRLRFISDTESLFFIPQVREQILDTDNYHVFFSFLRELGNILDIFGIQKPFQNTTKTDPIILVSF